MTPALRVFQSTEPPLTIGHLHCLKSFGSNGGIKGVRLRVQASVGQSRDAQDVPRAGWLEGREVDQRKPVAFPIWRAFDLGHEERFGWEDDFFVLAVLAGDKGVDWVGVDLSDHGAEKGHADDVRLFGIGVGWEGEGIAADADAALLDFAVQRKSEGFIEDDAVFLESG
jgi:hypothetical protein